MSFRLKGIPSWSNFYRNPIKLASIINMSYRKRKFMIRDQGYPYVLRITAELHNEQEPVLNFNIKNMTYRYKSEEELLNDVNKMNKADHINEIIKSM